LLVQNNAASIINHRIARFAKLLELPERRILDWCFVQAVLAWAWTLEDGCDENYFHQLTQIFDS
jgi:streptomycin 6-kinase